MLFESSGNCYLWRSTERREKMRKSTWIFPFEAKWICWQDIFIFHANDVVCGGSPLPNSAKIFFWLRKSLVHSVIFLNKLKMQNADTIRLFKNFIQVNRFSPTFDALFFSILSLFFAHHSDEQLKKIQYLHLYLIFDIFIIWSSNVISTIWFDIFHSFNLRNLRCLTSSPAYVRLTISYSTNVWCRWKCFLYIYVIVLNW